MDGSALGHDQQALLVDALKAADRESAKAQARRAQLMVEFADARKRVDRQRIENIESTGGEPRYRPGEFAATEIGLAVTETKRSVQKAVARARRVQAEAPDAWDAWVAGDINEAKVAHISHALRRLVRDDSKRMLNMLVVPAAVRKTPELLRRWLNGLVVRLEPELADERIRRSLEDRYVSVRPDLDGVSFLSACLPSLDAASVDLVLDALVGIADPGDPRTKPQRRADAMVDLLLGRISNGWHAAECGCTAGSGESGCAAAAADRAATEPDVHGDRERPDGGQEPGNEPEEDVDPVSGVDPASEVDPGPSAGSGNDPQVGVRAWDEDDWDLPAGAFRPDPPGRADDQQDVTSSEEELPVGSPVGRSVCTCPGTGRPPPQVTIGVVVSMQSLLGFTDTPGELADGSTHVPVGVIRELAARPGTLFYRLLTDPTGNLLDVTELGRFPSDKLADAIRFRDGVCSSPSCHAPAHRCDLDHVVRYPEGPTAAWNLDVKCRNDHRAKTHAGFRTTLSGGRTTWATPTGHRYEAVTDPLPVEPWPDDTG